MGNQPTIRGRAGADGHVILHDKLAELIGEPAASKVMQLVVSCEVSVTTTDITTVGSPAPEVIINEALDVRLEVQLSAERHVLPVLPVSGLPYSL